MTSPRPDRPTTQRTPRRRVPHATATEPTRPGRLRARTAAVRQRGGAGRQFVPSALTILAICAGLTAVKAATDDRLALALSLVVVAALLDGIDGRVARMMGATSAIGAEIDSLADAINFGVVPALVIYTALLDDEIGWALVLLYCCAIVLRLARFNTLLDDDSAPGYTRDFFVGVPAPAAAIIALLPIGLGEQFGAGWWTGVPFVGAWLVFAALLAVSRLPTYSFKTSAIPSRALAGLLLLVAGCAALLFTFPYVLMIAAIAAYLLHLPFAWYSRRWVADHPEHWESAAPQRRMARRAARATSGSRVSTARLRLRRPEAPGPQQSPTETPNGER